MIQRQSASGILNNTKIAGYLPLSIFPENYILLYTQKKTKKNLLSHDLLGERASTEIKEKI